MSDKLDRLVAELARKESAGLLADALAQARRQVRDDLARRLAAAITAELTSTQDATENVVDPLPHAESPPEHGLYAYGIVRDLDPDLPVTGIGSAEPPWVVTHDGLGLVVSDIRVADLAGLDTEQPAEHSRLAEFARGHDTVVRAVFDRAPILPLRFGTVLTDTAAATELLARQREDAVATLDRIAGKREWGAKVAPAPAEPEQAPVVDSAPSGTEYLARKRDELAARKVAGRRRRETLDRAHATLAEHATDDMRRATGENVLLDSAFLVPDAATDDFLTVVDQVARDLADEGLVLRATGPWPPYSFAVLERTGA